MRTVLRIAVLDSGVNPRHPHVGRVAAGYNATSSGNENEWLDFLGHGTAVAGAISDHAPEAELVVVKIFDRALRADLATIERGLAWALAQDVDFINLSLGSANPEHAQRLAAWTARGSTWVSAAEADGQVLFPGSLPGVIGVVADPSLERHQYRRREDGRFAAAPYPRDIPGVARERNLVGISFAVANLTGLLAQERWSRSLPELSPVLGPAPPDS